MIGFKTFVFAAAMTGAVVASTSDYGLCITAPAVTTTVTVTQCGQPTGLGIPPPAETSWVPPAPAPAPTSSSPASPAPGPSDSAPTSWSESSPSQPTPTVSSDWMTSAELVSMTASETTPGHLSAPWSSTTRPTSTGEPEGPPSGAGSVTGNLRSVFAVGMAIGATITLLV